MVCIFFHELASTFGKLTLNLYAGVHTRFCRNKLWIYLDDYCSQYLTCFCKETLAKTCSLFMFQNKFLMAREHTPNVNNIHSCQLLVMNV